MCLSFIKNNQCNSFGEKIYQRTDIPEVFWVFSKLSPPLRSPFQPYILGFLYLNSSALGRSEILWEMKEEGQHCLSFPQPPYSMLVSNFLWLPGVFLSPYTERTATAKTRGIAERSRFIPVYHWGFTPFKTFTWNPALEIWPSQLGWQGKLTVSLVGKHQIG